MILKGIFKQGINMSSYYFENCGHKINYGKSFSWHPVVHVFNTFIRSKVFYSGNVNAHTFYFILALKFQET